MESQTAKRRKEKEWRSETLPLLRLSILSSSSHCERKRRGGRAGEGDKGGGDSGRKLHVHVCVCV